MRINFNYQDLEIFLAVAEVTSFSLAADQTGVSQSVITRRVKSLEAELGIQLFERTTRSVKLTLAGKRLKLRAQSMLEDAVETVLELRDETALFEFQKNSIITVAAIPSAIPRAIIQAIQSLKDKGSHRRVRILDLLANEVVEAVSSGEADFGVSSLAELEDNTEFAPLFEDHFVLAMHKDHPLASRPEVKWVELSGEALILPMRGSGNRMLIDRELSKNRIDVVWSYEVPRTTTALELVSANLGIAALPFSAIPPVERLAVATCRLVAPEISRTIGIVTRSGSSLSNAARGLLECLTERPL